MHRPCKHYSNIVNNSLHHVYFSSLFFSSFSGYVFIPYHIRKCTQTMYAVTCQQQSTSCLFFFFLFSSLYGYIFALITILKNMHRPWFLSYFFHLKMQNLLYLEIFSVHSSHWILVLFHSGDYSGVNTRISLFHGSSEILAGKFHWNGTGIHRNDYPAGICGASLKSWSEAQAIVDLRPILVTYCRDHKICRLMVIEMQRYEDPWTCGCRYARIRGSMHIWNNLTIHGGMGCMDVDIWRSKDVWIYGSKNELRWSKVLGPDF